MAEEAQHIGCAFHDVGARPINALNARVTEIVVILRRNDAARDDLDVVSALFAQLLARYERWRSLDTFMVALATDGLTRLFGVPGRAAATVRRLGLDAVDRMPGVKRRFMAEARGESGAVPRLLTGTLA